jgi:hypothetical protein
VSFVADAKAPTDTFGAARQRTDAELLRPVYEGLVAGAHCAEFLD